MRKKRAMRLVLTVVAAIIAFAGAAQAGGTLRVALTATDVPTTTGAPDNGGEGLRFLGFPVFESLVLWDLTRADKLAEIRPGLAERWEQDKNDLTKWVFRLRKGVKFHDGTDWNADAAIWNLDRFLNKDAPQFDPPNAAVTQAPLEEHDERVEDQRDDPRGDEDQQDGAGGARHHPQRQHADRQHDELHPARNDDRLGSGRRRLALERVVVLEFLVEVCACHGTAREYGPW